MIRNSGRWKSQSCIHEHNYVSRARSRNFKERIKQKRKEKPMATKEQMELQVLQVSKASNKRT
jgi:hypothetical protein